MDKNWLIRTSAKQILGPVSLKKIKELISKGSLKEDDEISCGNGYWFFIRESELVSKYVDNEISQGFNPVSEAETVLCNNLDDSANSEETQLPQEQDLEYPDEVVNDEKEQILASLKVDEEQEVVQEDEDITTVQKIPTPPNTPNKKIKPVNIPKQKVKKGLLNQNVLLFLAGLLFVLALFGFYYRKRLIKQFIEASVEVVIPSGYAQVIPESVKKKLII